MRITICDDEKRICAILAGKVGKICPSAEITTYTSGEELLGADILPDILLLDIKMPGMSGMDVAKTLRDRDWRKILIFITGEEDQVFNSFDLHAFHFLVKPVTDGKLKEVLENAVKDLERSGAESGKHDKYIEIQSGTSHIRVNLSLLLYAEVYDRKTILHMKNESIEYYGQLSVLESLVGKDFYRIHRSYLVNMKYVERYDRTSVTLTGGDNIPISRREYDGFLKAYLIQVKNSFAGKLMPDPQTDLPETSKDDKESHGYGLTNMKRITEKYYGTIQLEQHEDMVIFTALLMIPD